jgi:hypothetical protein
LFARKVDLLVVCVARVTICRTRQAI